MQNGIYCLQFQASVGGSGTGIVVVSNGSLNGGDLGHTYQGRAEISTNNISARIRVIRYNPDLQSVFGSLNNFELNLSGTSSQNGDEFTLSGTVVGQPQLRITVIGKKLQSGMSEIEMQHHTEKYLVSSLLFESIGKVSAILDSFSGWLLGGFAATVTLLISQLTSLTKYIPIPTIRYCLLLFLASVIVALIQKYISLPILAGSQSAAVAREMTAKEPFNQPGLNQEVILSEFEHAIFFPMRWFVKRSFVKIRQGDLTAGARNFVRWGQVQGFLILSQVALLLWAILVIYGGLKLFVEK